MRWEDYRDKHAEYYRRTYKLNLPIEQIRMLAGFKFYLITLVVARTLLIIVGFVIYDIKILFKNFIIPALKISVVLLLFSLVSYFLVILFVYQLF